MTLESVCFCYTCPEGQVESQRRRILFVAEDLTLAQVVRLSALAERLDPRLYEAHFACRDFDPLIFRSDRLRLSPLRTVDKHSALRRLERGERIYDERTLSGYVEDELKLFDRVRPDLVVGDFRLSLSVSAPRAGLPLATLINAYWSPYAIRTSFPVPDHPIVSLIGPERAARYMPQALPRAFAHFAAPLATVRRKFGLPPMEDLLEQLTYGDVTLYADVPELCPIANAPSSHCYLGRIPWSPAVALPAWWDQLRDDLPIVYVTLGSSGAVAALPAVLSALDGLPVQVLLASAGRAHPGKLPDNVHLADYLPGDQACRRSALVLTNGGSSTGYQALAEGVPVLGVPSNMDQYLAMTQIENAGAGLLVRAGGIDAYKVRRAALTILDSPRFRRAAQQLASAFAQYDCFERFSTILSRVAAPSTSNGPSPTLLS